MNKLSISQNNWAALGALLAMLSIMAGAFGAHLLEHKLPDGKLEVFNTAARYLMYHALAIVIVALLEVKRSKLIMRFFLLGIMLFSGGLFAYSISYLFYDYGFEFLGILAPFGGLCFILGWFFLALGFISKKA